jgi:hypothetical protein
VAALIKKGTFTYLKYNAEQTIIKKPWCN